MPSDGKTRFSMPALAPGIRLNDTYEIDAHIAAGGMGEVYRGHNIETGEPVAIKTILPELARDEAILALFRREATVLGRLRHDTIVHYYSFSRDPATGQPYLAMEFVEGQSLSDRIAAGPLGGREAATLLMRLAEGLAVAHEAGIIHRDLSPDNIILRGGDVRHPRIIDFGIARSLQGGEGTLIGSNFAGKFNFVSPEQLGMGNGEVTNRSDIYGLALVMAAALRGKPLDMSGTHVAVIEKRRSVPDLTGVDHSLLPLLERMLAPDPANRPADMTEVSDWLKSHLADRPPSVPPLPVSQAATVPVPGEPARTHESPFGPAPAVRPPLPVAASAAPRRRSGSALAAGVVAVLALGGAGAAYLAGMFGGEGAGQTAATAPAPDRSATAQPPQVAGTEPEEPKSATVARPADEASSQAAPDATPPPAAEATDPTDRENISARLGDPQPAPPAPDQPAASQQPPVTDGLADRPAETALAERDLAAASSDDVVAAIDAAAPGPAPLRSDCFFARIASAADDTLAIRGMALSEALFQTISKTVTDAGGKPPIIEGPIVSAAQCAVADFLDTAHPHAKDDARLTLSSATPRIGGTLTATVAGAGERSVRLLAVDGEGKVRMLGAESRGDDEGRATVAVSLEPKSFSGEAAHIVLAIVGDMPIGVPEGAAAAYFPALAESLLKQSETFALDFAHFRLTAKDAAPSFDPVAYAPGAIRPNHLSQSELDRALIEFYREWKKLYLAQECGEGRWFVKVGADGKDSGEGGQKSITSSEAHGYGMLALALMAGADPDAQLVFDGMFHFRADHPARSNRHLMAWSQVEGCATAGEAAGGRNTATDGDLDIAYSLLLADAAWGSNGRLDYRRAALDMIGAILEHEVAAEGDFLLLGDWAATSEEKRFRTATRASDLMLAHLKAFADASGEQRWLAVRDRGYDMIGTVTAKFSPKTALMPDYLFDVVRTPKPAPAGFMDGDNDGNFSWNAARYPWRVGLDFLLNGEERAREALGGLNKWIRRKVNGDPAAIADTYRLNGSAVPGAGTGALTFVALIGVSAMTDADNQAWLNAVWDHVAAQKIGHDDFHGNTLKLMAMIAMSGHWARP